MQKLFPYKIRAVRATHYALRTTHYYTRCVIIFKKAVELARALSNLVQLPIVLEPAVNWLLPH